MERNYEIYDKEMLVVIRGLEHIIAMYLNIIILLYVIIITCSMTSYHVIYHIN